MIITVEGLEFSLQDGCETFHLWTDNPKEIGQIVTVKKFRIEIAAAVFECDYEHVVDQDDLKYAGQKPVTFLILSPENTCARISLRLT